MRNPAAVLPHIQVLDTKSLSDARDRGEEPLDRDFLLEYPRDGAGIAALNRERGVAAAKAQRTVQVGKAGEQIVEAVAPPAMLSEP